MVSTSGSSEQKAPGAMLSSAGHGQEMLFMNPLMLSDMSLTSSVHYICSCQQEWFSSSDPCVLSAPFIFNLHSCFKKSTGACSISAFGFFLCPPTAICYLLLSTIMPFFTPLCGFAWLLLPLGTSCLPLRAYLIYLIFKKNSHLKTHVFSVFMMQNCSVLLCYGP